MFPFEINDNHSLIVLGLSIVALVLILRRTLLRPRFAKSNRSSPEIVEKDDSIELSTAAVVEKLEVRLYDFAREVEGRLQTKIAVLDRLIVDADREIIRLEQVLAETRRSGAASPPGSRQPDAVVSPTHPDAA
ncbi:MAG: hypothetical protein HY290_11070 [Planctomycetia bacterium]|nr:hypothetical protein [Planctomycetia bacterium]